MSKYTDYAQDILSQNDTGEWTIPAGHVYPHQWLWDSAFIAIGLATYNPQRAALELTSLLRGQWRNGMIPHMIFSPQPGRPDDSWLWRSKKASNLAPADYWTSGITQPPIIADAVQRVARQLSGKDRTIFLNAMVPALIDYHQWLYRERDPDKSGLITLHHPWETGLDNTPSWQFANSYIHTPRWLKLAHQLGVDSLIDSFRTDIDSSDEEHRVDSYQMLKLIHVARSLKKQNYDWAAISNNPYFAVKSVSFNAMLIRNNQILRELCQETNTKLPQELKHNSDRAIQAFEQLWEPDFQEYFHRDVTTNQLVPISTISSLIALYSGIVPENHVATLVDRLHDPHHYQTPFMIPTVPVGSSAFNERRYWQGPVWLNTNWLVYDGLKRIGLEREAVVIRDASMQLFEERGSFEYFSPKSGEGLGIQDFSWSSALYLAFATDY